MTCARRRVAGFVGTLDLGPVFVGVRRTLLHPGADCDIVRLEDRDRLGERAKSLVEIDDFVARIDSLL